MWQVRGQDKILALLDHSLKEDSIAHSYLLVGPRHVGKGTLALNLAQALNCDGPQRPCGQCRSCRLILEGKHADVITLSLGSGTETAMDDAREPNHKVEIGRGDIGELQHLAHLPPYEGKCKVFIIEDADYMSTEAANRLLKILEEPPPNVVWLLLAVAESRLLPTVISRCQRLELRPMPTEQVQGILADYYHVESDKARLLARLCHGCLGWALSALADDSLLQQRSQNIDQLTSLLGGSLDKRFTYARDLAAQFGQDRRAVMETMEVWLSWWRDLMLIKGGCKGAIINMDYEGALRRQAKRLSLSKIIELITILCLTKEHVSRNVSARLAFESFMLNLPKKIGGFPASPGAQPD
jgi:DNA polymerase-3 subunit delta'